MLLQRTVVAVNIVKLKTLVCIVLVCTITQAMHNRVATFYLGPIIFPDKDRFAIEITGKKS